jgi:hypothetical protein
VFRRCHPRDVLTHALNLIHFEKLPLVLDEAILTRAFESCFVQEDESTPLAEAPPPAPQTALAKIPPAMLPVLASQYGEMHQA